MLGKFICLFLSIFVTIVYSQDRSLYILHTNNTNGALENCYCPDHPLGSIEKRALYVQDFIKSHSRTLVVDAGDFFTMSKKLLKDSLVCEAYATIPYDALLLGDQELTRGPEFLNNVLPKTQASIVVTNLESLALPSLRKYKIVKRGGLNIGILGIVGGNAMKYYPQEIRDSIIVTDPITAINDVLGKITTRTDIIVLLTHQGFDQDLQLAQELEGVDVIVGSHSQTVPEEPIVVNNILISQAGREGYYVGVIELKLSKYKKVDDRSISTVAMTQEMPDHTRVMELVKYYEETSGLINRKKLKALHGTDY
jgi:2',3'-cyclic-nucleotide 2'-phosphodiesterase (5'-nucleotidase family)